MSLKQYVHAEKDKYLQECRTDGGTADGFRARIAARFEANPDLLTKYALDATMEAATRGWQTSPRDEGDDLFTIAGVKIPEHLTRPSNLFASGEDVADKEESKFEKVHAQWATVSDAIDDATIKSRKAGQAAAKAEQKWKAVDEARRRARGNLSAFLKDLADQPAAPKADRVGGSLHK